MVVADHVVAEKGGDPGERVAQHRAANVSDVHRLRHVWRTKIDHDFLRGVSARDAEALVLEEGGSVLRDGLGAEREVDETGAGDRRRLAQVPSVICVQYFLRKRARIFAELFGQNERGVGLIIAETRVGRRCDRASLRQASRG